MTPATTFIEVPAVRPTYLQLTAIESWRPTSDRTRTLVTMLSGVVHRVDLTPDEFKERVIDAVVEPDSDPPRTTVLGVTS